MCPRTRQCKQKPCVRSEVMSPPVRFQSKLFSENSFSSTSVLIYWHYTSEFRVIKLMSQQCSSVMADDVPSDIHTLNIRCAVSGTLPKLMISVRVMCTDIISLQVERQHTIGRVGGNNGSSPAFFIGALWGYADKHRDSLTDCQMLNECTFCILNKTPKQMLFVL